jgi:hypothetical protein
MSSRACFLLAVAAACGNPGGTTPRPTPPPVQATLQDLVGGWRWMLRTTEAGTSRVEDELWRFEPVTGDPSKLVGRYLRSVEVRSDDRVPFQCNQRPWYRQRAMFELVVDMAATGFTVRETDYHAEQSPCDHGFRKLGSYTAVPVGDHLKLSWPGGTQVLWQIDGDRKAPLPEDPWPAKPELAGAWRWDATSWDDDGNIRDEHEWWQITRRTDTALDATYRRRVTTRSSDDKPLPCANATSWTFDDAYVLTGVREEEHWHFTEVAAEPGDHPCLRVTPKRNLDEATAEQLGDFLILEWRGKRRQILYRPE